jgi:hypothetical protein
MHSVVNGRQATYTSLTYPFINNVKQSKLTDPYTRDSKLISRVDQEAEHQEEEEEVDHQKEHQRIRRRKSLF